MIRENKTYGYAEEAVEGYQKRLRVLQWAMPFWLAFYYFFSPIFTENSFLTKMITWGVSVIFCELFTMILPYFAIPQLKTTTLTFNDTGLQFMTKGFRQEIPYPEIREIVICKKPSGDVAYIRIKTPANKGLRIENLADTLAIETELVARTAVTPQYKQQPIDWNSPWVAIVSVVVLFTGYIMAQKVSFEFWENMMMVSSFLMGMGLLVFRPIKRAYGERYEKWEIVLGIFFLWGIVALLWR